MDLYEKATTPQEVAIRLRVVYEKQVHWSDSYILEGRGAPDADTASYLTGFEGAVTASETFAGIKYLGQGRYEPL